MIMRKMNALPFLLAVIVLLTAVSACTRKNNPAGDNWSDVTPLIAVDSTFQTGYSYTHSGKVSGSETSLLCGTETGIEAVSFIRFTGLPDTSFTFIEQPVLKLVATRRSAFRRDPLALSFHKLNTHWAADSTDNILDADIVSLEISNYAVQDTVDVAGDTLEIDFPEQVIENWATGDTTGFNLVIKTTGTSWLEYKSRESGNGPLLSFKYKITGTEDTLSYSQRPIMDSYRITGEQTALIENTWMLKNLRPMRLFVRNGLPDGIFKDKDGIQLDSLDIKRMTINKAELVLFVKDNPYYSNKICYFFPYRVKPDTLINPVVLTDDHLEIITHTASSAETVVGDSVKINITPLIQAFTSEDEPNNGIVIKNNSEMLNFGNIEFWHYGNAPAGKKPYVKIYYTVPYLK
jgi:hypothetical protein